MKKLLSVFTAILFILATCIFSFASYSLTQYETAFDLYNTWRVNGYPDYVCGVWTTAERQNLTIGVQYTDEGLKGIEDIKDMVKDDSTLKFIYQQHSFKYLESVQDELSKLFKTNDAHGLVSTAIAEKKNRISLGILKGYEDCENTKKLIEDLTNEYGDIFIVYYTEPFKDDVAYGAVSYTDNNTDNNQIVYTTIIVSLLLMLMFFYIYRNHSHLLHTTTGTIVATTPHLKNKQIKAMVKKSNTDYPQELDKKILDAIINQT